MPGEKHSGALLIPLAGLLTWAIPGLGHFLIGDRARGLIFLVTISATFWTGVAIGGVVDTVDPRKHKLWFVAQICTGGNTLAAVAVHNRVVRAKSARGEVLSTSHWGSVDVGVHYSGVAGLLNLLVILDAIARADPSWAAKRRYRNRKHAP